MNKIIKKTTIFVLIVALIIGVIALLLFLPQSNNDVNKDQVGSDSRNQESNLIIEIDRSDLFNIETDIPEGWEYVEDDLLLQFSDLYDISQSPHPYNRELCETEGYKQSWECTYFEETFGRFLVDLVNEKAIIIDFNFTTEQKGDQFISDVESGIKYQIDNNIEDECTSQGWLKSDDNTIFVLIGDNQGNAMEIYQILESMSERTGLDIWYRCDTPSSFLE